jgi:hypothetical protein
MSVLFEDQEKAHEAKFRQDQDLAFKIRVRHAKLLGLWAAERIGLAGEQAALYACGVVDAALEGAHPDVVRWVTEDLTARNQPADDNTMHAAAALLWTAARNQVEAETCRTPRDDTRPG